MKRGCITKVSLLDPKSPTNILKDIEHSYIYNHNIILISLFCISSTLTRSFTSLSRLKENCEGEGRRRGEYTLEWDDS